MSIANSNDYVKQDDGTLALTRALLSALWQGGANGLLWTPNAGETLDRNRSTWFRTDRPIFIPAQMSGPRNAYFGVNPTTTAQHDPTKPAQYQASTNDTVQAINCLYSEFDGKSEVNPAPGDVEHILAMLQADPELATVPAASLRLRAENEAREACYRMDPEYYMMRCRQRVDALPIAPSVLWNSGGGYQAIWLLDETFTIATDADRERAAYLQRAWVQTVGGDPGVCDLRRVLRLPGSTNYKSRYAPDYPVVEFVYCNLDRRFTLDELSAVLPPMPKPTPKPTPTKRTATPLHRNAPDGTGATWIDVAKAYNETHDHKQALLDAGYKMVGKRMAYPGSKRESVTLYADASVHHSSTDPLYSGDKNGATTRPRRAFDVFVQYTHDGDFRAATRAAALELGMAHTKPTPTQDNADPVVPPTPDADGTTDQRLPDEADAYADELDARAKERARGLTPRDMTALRDYIAVHGLGPRSNPRTAATDQAVATALLDIGIKFYTAGAAKRDLRRVKPWIEAKKGDLAIGEIPAALSTLAAMCNLASKETAQLGIARLGKMGLVRKARKGDGKTRPDVYMLNIDAMMLLENEGAKIERFDLPTNKRSILALTYLRHRASDVFTEGSSAYGGDLHAPGKDGLRLAIMVTARKHADPAFAVSIADAANMLGCTPKTASKLLGRMADVGLMSCEDDGARRRVYHLYDNWADRVTVAETLVHTYGAGVYRASNAAGELLAHCSYHLYKGANAPGYNTAEETNTLTKWQDRAGAQLQTLMTIERAAEVADRDYIRSTALDATARSRADRFDEARARFIELIEAASRADGIKRELSTVTLAHYCAMNGYSDVLTVSLALSEWDKVRTTSGSAGGFDANTADPVERRFAARLAKMPAGAA